jgi:hypothetical protein
MTSDLEATTGDLYNTIRDLWLEAQPAASVDIDPAERHGQTVTSIRDTDIAGATGLELQVVREYLDNADGVTFVVGRDGDTRLVEALV